VAGGASTDDRQFPATILHSRRLRSSTAADLIRSSGTSKSSCCVAGKAVPPPTSSSTIVRRTSPADARRLLVRQACVKQETTSADVTMDDRRLYAISPPASTCVSDYRAIRAAASTTFYLLRRNRNTVVARGSYKTRISEQTEAFYKPVTPLSFPNYTVNNRNVHSGV